MIKELFSHWRHYRLFGLLCPLIMIIEVAVDIATPLIMAQLIDKGVAAQNVDIILRMGMFIILAGLLGLACGGLGAYLASYAAMGFGADLREDLYRKIQTYTFQNLDRFPTSTLITRITNDVQQTAVGLMSIVRTAIRAPLMLIFALVMAYRQSARLGSVFFYMIPIMVLVIVTVTAVATPRFRRMQESLDEMNGFTQENLRSVREVKGFVREEQQIEHFDAFNRDLYRKATRAIRVVMGAFPLLNCVANVFIAIIFWIGGRMILAGEFEIGRLSAFITYAFQITFSVIFLSFILMNIARANTSGKRIVELFRIVPDMTTAPQPCRELRSASIEFDHVSFRYPNMSDDAVRDLSFRAESGAKIGIIGTTGSGKSSLVQLIPRLYDCSRGSVKIGGTDVREFDPEWLRRHIAFVFQKNLLFSGTVRENMLWGRPDASEEEIWAALESADAASFIRAKEEGLDARVERDGTNFSGGQRQRLCIARALLRQPKILILDDSTSAVDPATEARIRGRLAEHYPDVTQILIAQRIGSIEHCDLILVTDEGKIEAQGKHEELLERSEVYRSIYESQQKGMLAHA